MRSLVIISVRYTLLAPECLICLLQDTLFSLKIEKMTEVREAAFKLGKWRWSSEVWASLC